MPVPIISKTNSEGKYLYSCPTCKTRDGFQCLTCAKEINDCTCVPVRTYCYTCETGYSFSSRTKYKIIEGAKPIVFECVCVPEKTFICYTCGVERNNTLGPWQAKAQITIPNTSKSAGKTTTVYVEKCRHYHKPVKIPNGPKIYCSSRRDHKVDVPDFGLYADYSWRPLCRAEFINWPDMSEPVLEHVAADAIIDAYHRAVDGERVEIGCIGGHGRTGTMLACMLVLNGMKPAAAIKFVHKKYCTEAIESDLQEWYIEWFDCYIHGGEPPSKPELKYVNSKLGQPGCVNGPCIVDKDPKCDCNTCWTKNQRDKNQYSWE